MEQLSQLISRLRRERGITQSELGERAGIDKDTIAKVEGGRGRAWRPSTARRVIEALQAVAPISAADAEAFTAATGVKVVPLSPGLAQGFRPARQPASLERVENLARELVGRIGVEHVQRILETLLSFPFEDAGDEQLYTVARPPRQVDVGGVPAVEQEFRSYAPVAPPHGAKPAKKRRGA